MDDDDVQQSGRAEKHIGRRFVGYGNGAKRQGGRGLGGVVDPTCGFAFVSLFTVL